MAWIAGHVYHVPIQSALQRMQGAAYEAMRAVAAIVILLLKFDGEPIFDGRMITLNAVISTPSTTSRVSLLAMLASAISQWNWLLFSSEPRRLADFEYISAASRGPLGSAKVLLNFHILGGAIVRAGALVTILTIALDPFAQQLVQLEESRRVEEGVGSKAFVAKADGYSLGAVGFGVSPEAVPEVDGRSAYKSGSLFLWVRPDLGMKIATVLTYVDTRSGIGQEVAYNCPSADCEFDPFDSLAVCRRCDDITASLKNRIVERNESSAGVSDTTWYPGDAGGPESTEYYLRNGLYLSNINSVEPSLYMIMFGTAKPNKTVTVAEDTLVWAQTIIRVDAKLGAVRSGWPGPKISAQECQLYYCVRRYTAVIQNGTLEETSVILENHKWISSSWQPDDEKIVAAIFNSSRQRPDNSSLRGSHAMAFPSNLELGDPKSSKRWYITPEAVYNIRTLMKEAFTACLGWENCIGDLGDLDMDPPSGHMWSLGGFEPPIAQNLWHEPELTFLNMARGISTALRNGADDSKNATGTVFIRLTVYKVSWPWISLRCMATLGALLFLVATIRSTSRAELPAWKSSELAVFARGAATDGVFTGGETCPELEEKAKAVSVALLEKKSEEEHGGPVEDIPLRSSGASKMASSIRGRQVRGEYTSAELSE